ncbi:hypothetical protein F2Q69_00059780 [Brassica cretica]|uniref:Arabidopsis retrotransposon Orf1 C-terminal domain-containing protein n=1 Tax=Brassica cretica TaxID=69181 RepID=A0A8S9RDE1_BRACR|nr:hypothetical protein F2Q69_00059780 [Brassica cretica]
MCLDNYLVRLWGGSGPYPTATAELTFKKPDFPIFEEAYFTFFASGVKHSISLEKLTEIYEISEEYTKTSFPRKFPPVQAFWKFIASGDFKSRSASQSRIRNPILRIDAKVLRNLLFSKDQTSKVQRGELQMLFAGVENEIRSTNIGIPTAQMMTSPGCVLVQMFVDKKLAAAGVENYRFHVPIKKVGLMREPSPKLVKRVAIGKRLNDQSRSKPPPPRAPLQRTIGGCFLPHIASAITSHDSAIGLRKPLKPIPGAENLKCFSLEKRNTKIGPPLLTSMKRVNNRSGEEADEKTSRAATTYKISK